MKAYFFTDIVSSRGSLHQYVLYKEVRQFHVLTHSYCLFGFLLLYCIWYMRIDKVFTLTVHVRQQPPHCNSYITIAAQYTALSETGTWCCCAGSMSRSTGWCSMANFPALKSLDSNTLRVHLALPPRKQKKFFLCTNICKGCTTAKCKLFRVLECWSFFPLLIRTVLDPSGLLYEAAPS